MAKATWKYFRDGCGYAGRCFPKSEATKQKMREAALRRYQNPNERIRTQQAVKKAFETIDRSGANNGHVGKPVSEETRQKMRDRLKERGGYAGARNPNFRHGHYCEDV